MAIGNENMAREVAQALLEVQAVSLRPTEPFTWASGLKSPIYCDNRITLSHPQARSLVAQGLSALAKQYFGDADAVVGTATAGIAHAALCADRLELPMAYVRTSAKDHGKGNQIEGRILPGTKVVMVEDLISTGGSVLRAAQAVEESGAEVLGVLAIFSYELGLGHKAFADAGLPLYTLSNYPTLISVAAAQGYVTEEDLDTLGRWTADPKAWG